VVQWGDHCQVVRFEDSGWVRHCRWTQWLCMCIQHGSRAASFWRGLLQAYCLLLLLLLHSCFSACSSVALDLQRLRPGQQAEAGAAAHGHTSGHHHLQQQQQADHTLPQSPQHSSASVCTRPQQQQQATGALVGSLGPAAAVGGGSQGGSGAGDANRWVQHVYMCWYGVNMWGPHGHRSLSLCRIQNMPGRRKGKCRGGTSNLHVLHGYLQ
jgi:hypothetical protein